MKKSLLALCLLLPLAGPVMAGTATNATISKFTVTAYCPCKICCGQWAGGRTASGRKPRAGVTIAAPRNIPLGTWLNIAGLGKRRVDDRLAEKFDNRIDIFFSSHREALRFGIKTLSVAGSGLL